LTHRRDSFIGGNRNRWSSGPAEKARNGNWTKRLLEALLKKGATPRAL